MDNQKELEALQLIEEAYAVPHTCAVYQKDDGTFTPASHQNWSAMKPIMSREDVDRLSALGVHRVWIIVSVEPVNYD